MLSYPTNYKLPSSLSLLNTRTIPLGKGIPNPISFEFLNCTLFCALILRDV